MKKTLWTFLFIGYVLALAMFFAPIIKPATAHFSGRDVVNIKVYSPSLTPAATAAAIGTTQQTFSVSGLATANRIAVIGPVPTSLCPITGARVSAANTLQLDITTLTAAACTPASGTYTVVSFEG